MKKNNKIFLAGLIAVLLIVFLSGCWDSKDINEKKIVTAIGFDVKDGEIWFYLEIANIESAQSRNLNGRYNNKFIIVKCHGKTLSEARENLDKELDKPIYLSGVRVIVFTENFANKYLIEYLYRFRADETYRKKGLTVITKEDPEALFKIAHEKNESAGFIIEGICETLEDLGKSFTRTTERVIENLSSDYSGFLLPCIGMKNNEIALIGYSVVNGSQVTGLIQAANIKGIMFLKADEAEFNYILPHKDINFTIEVHLTKRRIKPSYENGKVFFDINFDFKAELLYGDKKTPYDFENKDMKKVSEVLIGLIKKDITYAIEQAQNVYKCDYLQFDDTFRIKYPVAFDRMDWQKEFLNSNIKAHVKVDLNNSWGLDYGINEVR